MSVLKGTSRPSRGPSWPDFDRLQFLQQSIEVAVGNLRRGLLVVKPVVMLNLRAKLGGAGGKVHAEHPTERRKQEDNGDSFEFLDPSIRIQR